MTISTCKSCGKDIIWIVTPNGKSMPLDAAAYTLWFIEPDGAQTGSPKARPILVRASHFATCKDADQWRTPR